MLFLVIALLVVSAGALQWKMMDGGKYSATTALASPGQADIFLQNAQIYCVSKPNRLPTQVDLWDADKPSYLSTHNITNNTLDFEAYMDKGLFTFTSQWYLNFSQQTCNPDRPTDLELKFPEVSAKMKTYISGVLVVLDQWSEPQKSGVFVIAGRIKCAGGDQISSAHVTGNSTENARVGLTWITPGDGFYYATIFESENALENLNLQLVFQNKCNGQEGKTSFYISHRNEFVKADFAAVPTYWKDVDLSMNINLE